MKMNKILAIVIAIALVLCAVFGIVGLKKHSLSKGEDSTDEVAAAESNQTQDNNAAVDSSTAKEEDDYDVNFREEKSDIDEGAYLEDMDREVVIDFTKAIEELPDVDDSSVENFYKEHKDIYKYQKDPEGVYLPPLSDESLMETDEERAFWAKDIGLVTYQTDDAIAAPFDLDKDQVKKITKAAIGTKIDFSDEELEDLRNELFRAWMENPILFESWVRLIADQKIGQEEVFGDHWKAGSDFLTIYDEARDDGIGMNIWLRKINDKYYTNYDYQKYVVAVTMLFFPKENDVIRLTAQPGNHYCLVGGDFNSMRKAAPADYSENLSSLEFLFRTKMGKIAIRIGANLYDKRPEVLNYTTTHKSTQQSTTQPTTSSTPPTASTPVVPASPQTSEGTKSPVDDSANAVTDHQDDDPGPGTWKPDIGNSTSPTVEGSQAHAGTVVNTDGGNAALYPAGPAADATDNGTPPDTSAAENQIGTGAGTTVTTGINDATGQAASTTTNVVDGRLNAAPPVD